MHEQAKAIKTIKTNCNPFDKTNKFDSTDLKIRKKLTLTYEYYHWGGNKKYRDTLNKRNKNLATLRLIEKRQELTKSGNLRFKFEAVSNSTNRQQVRVRSKIKKGPENLSSAEESDVVKPGANFFIVGLKKNDIAEITIHNVQVNHVIGKPKTKNAEAEKSVKKAEVNFMVDITTLRHKTSVDPKLVQTKIRVGNNQNERTSEENSPVFSELTKHFGFLFARDKNVNTEELMKQLVDALTSG